LVSAEQSTIEFTFWYTWQYSILAYQQWLGGPRTSVCNTTNSHGRQWVRDRSSEYHVLL